jgi:pimeloyl-ACP methyl ester carboxylesterase
LSKNEVTGTPLAPQPAIGRANFAADLALFMDAVDLPRAVIAGGSSGGFAARRFAIDQPERIASDLATLVETVS